MKKRISILAALALLVMMLGGCQLFCQHAWNEATCELPQTCAKCEKTEGEALGHGWAAATCEAPETCGNCGMTQGQALGHTWQEATCDTAKTCAACAVTEGEALGHTWEEATTETPQTCTVCTATEGEPLDTDDRFTTASTKHLQGKWVASFPVTATEMGLDGFEGVLECAMYMEFSNVGDLTMTAGTVNEESFRAELKSFMVGMLYEEFAGMGMDAAAADQAMAVTNGMSMEQYAATVVESINFDALLSSFAMNLYYYVADDQVYTALSWDGQFDGSNYTLEDGVLVIEEVYGTDATNPLEWTRVEE